MSCLHSFPAALKLKIRTMRFCPSRRFLDKKNNWLIPIADQGLSTLERGLPASSLLNWSRYCTVNLSVSLQMRASRHHHSSCVTLSRHILEAWWTILWQMWNLSSVCPHWVENWVLENNPLRARRVFLPLTLIIVLGALIQFGGPSAQPSVPEQTKQLVDIFSCGMNKHFRQHWAQQEVIWQLVLCPQILGIVLF